MLDEDRHASYCCVTLSAGDDRLSQLEAEAIAATALEDGYENRVRLYEERTHPDRPSYRIEMLDETRELPADRIEEAFRVQGRDPEQVVTYQI